MPARHWIASVALLVAMWPGTTRAQESSDWTQVPLTHTARVDLDGTIFFEPGRSWAISGLFAPFITEHWQVGAAAGYAGYVEPGASVQHGISITALANYHIGSSRRFRPYLGFFTNARRPTIGPGEAWYGVQVGGNYFLSPFTALRAELNYRIRFGEQQEYWNRSDFILTLDPYMRGRAAGSTLTPASLGTFDIAFTGRAELKPERIYSVNATLAPFLSRWLQLGGAIDYTYVPLPATYFSRTGIRAYTTVIRTGFARVYAPISARTIPFVGGALDSGESSFGSGYSSYRLLGGVRRQLGPRSALDVSLSRRRYPELTAGDVRYRPPDLVQLQAKVVTQMRRGR